MVAQYRYKQKEEGGEGAKGRGGRDKYAHVEGRREREKFTKRAREPGGAYRLVGGGKGWGTKSLGTRRAFISADDDKGKQRFAACWSE